MECMTGGRWSGRPAGAIKESVSTNGHQQPAAPAMPDGSMDGGAKGSGSKGSVSKGSASKESADVRGTSVNGTEKMPAGSMGA
jgi:hypothetical protein